MSNFVKSYTTIPKELFRINNGPVVRLRAYPGPRRPPGLFDLLTYAGKVKPKALSPTTYKAPNGASMRPNTPKTQRLVSTLRGTSACIYSIPAGVRIPDGLILVHEFKDHYSLQAGEETTVDALNARITDFLQSKGQCLTKEEWLLQYPKPTETE
ncbi:hypothetical protein P170DRAFT_511951 [Aspergillus steynii IBT 23096]|uniref:Tse2 ADP-ribosyltransferase toxin domain-containing protein n=1 Tax=Aspergillus steynii IBT 23096 TaxID=1392250 RepID=A0A2I2G395_9EURO|nr:uncharacterized protein P170DRAFT_511951 [Aspergillus steynii IBT 23096]PLB47327.1 hypothetical protein P170DRAFT_511951 [Aspergillus steynii IBT 23096]